jgi:hypothetical protein
MEAIANELVPITTFVCQAGRLIDAFACPLVYPPYDGQAA